MQSECCLLEHAREVEAECVIIIEDERIVDHQLNVALKVTWGWAV